MAAMRPAARHECHERRHANTFAEMVQLANQFDGKIKSFVPSCVLDERILALRPYCKKAQAATVRPFAAGKVKAKSIRRNRKCSG